MTKEEQKDIHELMKEINELAQQIKDSRDVTKLINDVFFKKEKPNEMDNTQETDKVHGK